MGCLWGVALLLAGLSACGSSSAKCTSNCKADASVDVADPVDHPVESDGSGDARVDAAEPRDSKGPIDGAVACDSTIAAACAVTADAGAFALHCAATWTASTSNAYLCGRPEVLSFTCGAEHELIDTSDDGTAEYIYVFDGSGSNTDHL